MTRHELIEAISSVIDGAASRETRPVQRSLSSETDSVAIRGVSILVAEDSPDNRLLISAYLRRTCYKLDFAENGQIALERFVSNHYDLVLMDMQMPVMDGFIATRAIREWERIHHAPHTNIVALTASALKADAVEARHAGCDAHVTKPVTKATLLDVICQNLPTPALPHD